MINPFSLDGKTILVTGASGGIGRQSAISCAEMGADVIITGRNIAKLQDCQLLLSKFTRKCCTPIEADLCNDVDIEHLVAEIEPIDGLVLCAGRNDKSLLKFIKRKNIEEMFNTNVYSEILLCKALLKKKKLKKGASIVFISSISSIYATISNTLYAATKGAINSIVRVLAFELSSNRIRVNGIMPGMIKTPMINIYGLSEEELQNVIKSYPLGRIGETTDIANAVIYLLSDASSWVTGLNMVIDGGVTLR